MTTFLFSSPFALQLYHSWEVPRDQKFDSLAESSRIHLLSWMFILISFTKYLLSCNLNITFLPLRYPKIKWPWCERGLLFRVVYNTYLVLEHVEDLRLGPDLTGDLRVSLPEDSGRGWRVLPREERDWRGGTARAPATTHRVLRVLRQRLKTEETPLG